MGLCIMSRKLLSYVITLVSDKTLFVEQSCELLTFGEREHLIFFSAEEIREHMGTFTDLAAHDLCCCCHAHATTYDNIRCSLAYCELVASERLWSLRRVRFPDALRVRIFGHAVPSNLWNFLWNTHGRSSSPDCQLI